MVERSLRMREARGSMPLSSKTLIFLFAYHVSPLEFWSLRTSSSLTDSSLRECTFAQCEYRIKDKEYDKKWNTEYCNSIIYIYSPLLLFNELFGGPTSLFIFGCFFFSYFVLQRSIAYSTGSIIFSSDGRKLFILRLRFLMSTMFCWIF